MALGGTSGLSHWRASKRVFGHDGDSLGDMVASLMTVPEHGIVVAAMSNISYADTFSLAVKIADVFAKQGNGIR